MSWVGSFTPNATGFKTNGDSGSLNLFCHTAMTADAEWPSSPES